MGHLTLDRLHDALATGDHFMCASEKQRDLWLGALLGQRRIDPELTTATQACASVLDTVPFGLPPIPRRLPRRRRVPRERFADVGQDARWCSGTAASGTGSTLRRQCAR